MMILDKKNNLKTLFSLGATPQDLRSIFFYQGVLMTAIGGVLGIGIGTLIIWVQQHFSVLMITSSIAYPVDLLWINITIVFVTILVLGTIASRIASQQIKKIQFKT
jgi:lipoprotein-releasing system permease protein